MSKERRFPDLILPAAVLLLVTMMILIISGNDTLAESPSDQEERPNWTSWHDTLGASQSYGQQDAGHRTGPSSVRAVQAGSAGSMIFYSEADADIASLFPDTNNGADLWMWAGYDDVAYPAGILHSLVRFDISDLPADVQITDARLRLFYVFSGDWDPAGTPRTITTHRIEGSWTEYGVTWNSPIEMKESYGSQDILSATDPDSSLFDWYDFDVTGLVSAWYDGTYPNNGVMLVGPQTPSTGVRGFATWEWQFAGGEDLTPQLVVEYTTAMSTPTSTPLPTNTPTSSPTPTATGASSATPEPTATDTPTATSTMTASPTITPASSSTPLPSVTPTETPTVTATQTLTPTATTTPLSPPTSTSTPAPQCTQWVVNPGFEQRDGWTLPQTDHPAAYSSVQVHGGSWAMRTGILQNEQNKYSYSSAFQWFTLPNGIPLYLRFNLYAQSSEPSALSLPADVMNLEQTRVSSAGDAQLAIIYSAGGIELQRPIYMRSNSRQWEAYQVEVSQYGGQRIQIYFGTYNNGGSGVTAMFVDDVTLTDCVAPPPAPSPYLFFVPSMLNDYPAADIAGRVTEPNNLPVAGVVIKTDQGQQAITDSNGNYRFSGLAGASYILTPKKVGYRFEPVMKTVDIPPPKNAVDFVAILEAYP